jgi:mucin-19
MAGILRTDTIQNSNTSTIITQTNSTTITIGTTGQTVALASGATQTGFGRTGTVNWDTTAKTTTVTAVSGVGYFVDTTTTTLTVNLPVGTAGSIVSVSDYANIAATNNITITPNGTDKIDGVNGSYTLATNGAAITLIYVDATRGWKDIYDSTLNAVGINPFVVATGGTITTCGNYKTHVFTGPGTFTVTNAGTPAGSTTVDYMVVAGGGGAGVNRAGGGGAGGWRASSGTASGSYNAGPGPLTSPVSALPVSVQGYPITVGAGGNAGPPSECSTGSPGNPSVFSTITSSGGGHGSPNQGPVPVGSGGSGGGNGADSGGQSGSGGAGNTPPVSPPQGNNGSPTSPGNNAGAGGGGAGAAGGSVLTPGSGGAGGNGVTSSISFIPTAYAGGGGGGAGPGWRIRC